LGSLCFFVFFRIHEHSFTGQSTIVLALDFSSAAGVASCITRISYFLHHCHRISTSERNYSLGLGASFKVLLAVMFQGLGGGPGFTFTVLYGNSVFAVIVSAPSAQLSSFPCGAGTMSDGPAAARGSSGPGRAGSGRSGPGRHFGARYDSPGSSGLPVLPVLNCQGVMVEQRWTLREQQRKILILFCIHLTNLCSVYSNFLSVAAASQEGRAAPTLLDTGYPAQVYLSNLDAVASTDWLAQIAPTLVVTCGGGLNKYFGLGQFGLVEAAILRLPLGSHPAHLLAVPSDPRLA